MPNKSFIVVDGELRLKITPSDGWYCVEGMDIKGLVTQGRTIEEAIYMAHDAAVALAESRALMTAQKAAREKKRKINPGKAAPGRRQAVKA
ncbi:MAG: hypothetical protein LBS30_07405 [Planctomycetota bacterium]|jgi:predicted RNase H-like HicB family nuclease|nr:hypothetical protein [Planctomycetota bacterium]